MFCDACVAHHRGCEPRLRTLSHRIGRKVSNLAADEVIAGSQRGSTVSWPAAAPGSGARGAGDQTAGSRAGRLHPLHRGVYAVGHSVVSQRGRWMAAVLASGDCAALSHRSAAALWDIRPSAGRIEVTVPRARDGATGTPPSPSRSPSRRGHDPRRHPQRPLRPAPSWTSLRSSTATPSSVRLSEAEVRRLRRPERAPRPLPDEAEAPPSCGALAPQPHTRSDLEARFVTFLNDHGFPPPLTNTLDRGIRGRRRLARPPPHRRARQLRVPRHPPSVRERPPARPPPHRGGLARDARDVARSRRARPPRGRARRGCPASSAAPRSSPGPCRRRRTWSRGRSCRRACRGC